MRAWGAVGSGISGLVAVATLFIALSQFNKAQDRWIRDTAIKTIFEGKQDQPYISYHCLSALAGLHDDQLLALHNREVVKLEPDQAEWVRRCFADFDSGTQSTMYSGDGALSPRGSALLAYRVNRALDKDDLVANFIIQGIGDETLLLSQYGFRLCGVDKTIIEKVRRVGKDSKVEDFETVYAPIVQFYNRGFCTKMPRG